MKNVFMKEAIEEAKKAYNLDEVPVGAVVVKDGVIISRAHNMRETLKKPSAHAEIIAIDKAAEVIGSWNLSECDLYVTLEPCPMCAGALLQSRIRKIYFGAQEPKSGCFGSVADFREIQGFTHYPEIEGGILQEACQEIIQDYFKEKRQDTVQVKRVTTQEQLQQCLDIRKKVFVQEQHVDISIEVDQYDVIDSEEVKHVIAVYQGSAVGTLRYFKEGKRYKVGRVAVLSTHRGLDIGTKMLNYVEKQALNNGIEEIYLGAQCRSMKFYLRNGYEAYGDVYEEANIEHQYMKKSLKEKGL
ncbi:GNAT family N-acetyltransferase [Erysipelothrix inopinata]|uniref:tRNA-specific adenosine deaminase n=1 Tax=Erysipelothrix inopinata TaxID=225084 RepID=A0A7G9S0H0_9FIRM|nr:GNAT family N-acetyltransferase [Erysipelothrix inopinata]